MNIRKQSGYLGVGGKRVIGGLGSNTALDALIRSLAPAAWFRQGVGITVTGSGVSQWDDQSGNGRHLLQGTDAARPIDLPFSGTRYLYLPGVAGNYASTPDSVANSITGSIDLRAYAALDDWTPGSANVALIAKDDAGANRCYRLAVTQTTGTLTFFYTGDGTTTTGRIATSSAATGIADGAAKWCRVTYNSSTGKVNFYLSDDGSSWSALGTEQTITSGAIFNGTNVVEVGSAGGGASVNAAGKIYRAIIKNGIDGTTVADFNPADADGDGDTSFASSTTGETWTINSSGGLPAQIVGRAAILFNGTSHYLKCNAFTLNQPTTVLLAVKQISYTAGDTLCDGNSVATMRVIQGNGSSGNLYARQSVTLQGGNLPIGTLGVVSYVANGANSSIGINLAASATGNTGVATNAGGFTLGANATPVGYFNGQFYEALVLPIAPSTAQLDRLVAGLMARHGVA